MKKKLFIISIALSCFLSCFASDEVKGRICDYISQEVSLNYTGFQLYIGEKTNHEYLVVVDLHPKANWGHDCLYYDISVSNTTGDINVIDVRSEQYLPNDIYLDKWSSQKKRIITPADAPVFVKENVPQRVISPSTNNYAVIISGGRDAVSNGIRFWNDCSYIYSVLRKYYNIPKNNIELFIGDGDDPAKDIENRFSSQLDLDWDNIDDLKYSATKENISNHFENLKDLLTKNDHLFIFVIDHGRYDLNRNESFIDLWNYERLYPGELNGMLNQLNCATINCVFGQCHSGGFILPLKAKNRIISTACDIHEDSHGDDSELFDNFVHSWTEALLQAGIAGNDLDSDGHISMQEAFEYAFKNDIFVTDPIERETPQYFSGVKSLGEDLCFDRFPRLLDLYIKDNKSDVGTEPNTSNNFSDSPDIWIRNRNDLGEEHQNLKYAFWGASTNYVKVRVTNRGITNYTSNQERQYVHLYWCTGTPIPTYDLLLGNKMNESGQPYGGYIGSAIINTDIYTDNETIVTIPWKIAQGSLPIDSSTPITLLALISDDERGLEDAEFVNKYLNPVNIGGINSLPIQNLSHIAVKSLFNPTSVSASGWQSNLSINGNSKGWKYYNLGVKSLDSNIYENISFIVKLPKDISVKSGVSCGEAGADTNDFPLNVTYPELNGILLSSEDIKKIDVIANINSTNFSGSLTPELYLREENSNSILGSYNFKCNIGDGALLYTNLSIDQSSNADDSIYLTAELGGTNTNTDLYAYEWFDSSGNSIGNSSSICLDNNYEGPVYLSATSNNETLSEKCYVNSTPRFIKAEIDSEEITISLSSSLTENSIIYVTSLDTLTTSYTTFVSCGTSEISIPRSELSIGGYYSVVLMVKNETVDTLKIKI